MSHNKQESAYDSDSDEYVIHGTEITNSRIPESPVPIGRVNRDGLMMTDDNRGMFYRVPGEHPFFSKTNPKSPDLYVQSDHSPKK